MHALAAAIASIEQTPNLTTLKLAQSEMNDDEFLALIGGVLARDKSHPVRRLTIYDSNITRAALVGVRALLESSAAAQPTPEASDAAQDIDPDVTASLQRKKLRVLPHLVLERGPFAAVFEDPTVPPEVRNANIDAMHEAATAWRDYAINSAIAYEPRVERALRERAERVCALM